MGFPLIKKQKQTRKDIYTCKVQTESVADNIAPIAANIEGSHLNKIKI